MHGIVNRKSVPLSEIDWNIHNIYNERNQSYSRTTICVNNDNYTAYFYIKAGYDFCCGVREIHGINTRNPQALVDLLKEFAESGEMSFGAYTYAYVEDSSGGDYYYAKPFLDLYPNATKGAPFYNPNSGNTITIYTLPIYNTRDEYYPEISDDEED